MTSGGLTKAQALQIQRSYKRRRQDPLSSAQLAECRKQFHALIFENDDLPTWALAWVPSLLATAQSGVAPNNHRRRKAAAAPPISLDPRQFPDSNGTQPLSRHELTVLLDDWGRLRTRAGVVWLPRVLAAYFGLRASAPRRARTSAPSTRSS